MLQKVQRVDGLLIALQTKLALIMGALTTVQRNAVSKLINAYKSNKYSVTNTKTIV